MGSRWGRTTARRCVAGSSVLALVALGFATAGSASAATDGIAFSFTGSAQPYQVPADVCSVTIDAFGASSGLPFADVSAVVPVGPAFTALPGLGGHATATIDVTPGETLQVYVGGKGADATNSGAGSGGFNGGASGRAAGTSGSTGTVSASVFAATGGGGGASDVRQSGNALGDRVVVAGGGGSEGQTAFGSADIETGKVDDREAQSGGDGGGDSGDPGQTGAFGGGGGTQSAGGPGGVAADVGDAGQLGLGGLGGTQGASGAGEGNAHAMIALGGSGGGGYYGGGGGGAVNLAEYQNQNFAGGGGGGSGFGPADTAYESGVRDGNGTITITPDDDTSCLPGGGGPPGTPNTIPRPHVFPTTPTTVPPAARPIAPAAAALAVSPRFTG